MQYSSTQNTKVPRGVDGPLFLAMKWPLVDNMSEYLAADGAHMRYPRYYTDTDLLNPLFGLYKNKFYDESDRFISNASVTITPIKNAFFRAQVGCRVWILPAEDRIYGIPRRRTEGIPHLWC